MKKSTLKSGLLLGCLFAIGFVTVRLVAGEPFTLKLVISGLAGGIAGGIAGAYVLAWQEKKKQQRQSG